MQKIIDWIEHAISYALILVGILYAAYQTTELVLRFGVGFWDSITNLEFISDKPGRPLAGLFFSVLLTLELVATVRVFAADHLTKIRIILLVGMIAVSRKILEMPMDHLDIMTGLAISALMASLSIAYFLVSRTAKRQSKSEDPQPLEH